MKQTEESSVPSIALGRALGTVIPLCLVALLIAGIIISVGNDLYAFVKPDVPVILKVDTSMTDEEFACELQELGVIENAFAFRMYVKSKGKADLIASLTGEWRLNSNMSYRENVTELTKK